MTTDQQDRAELNQRVRGERWSYREVLVGLFGLVVTVALAVIPLAYRDKFTDLAALTSYGLAGTLVISFIAASAFSLTAIPVPYWAVTFTLPTILAERYGIMAPVWVGLCTAVGASAAQFITFIIGYTGRGFTDKIGKRFGVDFYEKAVTWLKRHGGWAVFLMSVTTNPIHLPMTVAIAALHYPPWEFLLFSFLGMLVKSMILAFAGYYSLTFLLNLSQNPIVVTVFLILLGLVATVAVWQLVVWIFETRTKNRKYREAQAFARARNKQLLVIGGPWGVQPFRRWLNKPAHAGGDVCLDISARALAGHICPVVASVTDIPFADKAFGAVFLSHVLEHLPTGEDARKALDDMDRVADGVFFVYPSRQSIAAWIITDHKLWIWEKNGQIHIRQRRSAHKKGNSVGKAGSQIH